MLERTRIWNALPMTSTQRPSPPKSLHLPRQPRTATPRVVIVTGIMIHLQARSPDPAERATKRISARRRGETGAAVPTKAVVVAIGILVVVAQAAAVIAYLVAAVAESTATVAAAAAAAGVAEAEAGAATSDEAVNVTIAVVGALNVSNDLGADGADLQMVVLIAVARMVGVKLLLMP